MYANSTITGASVMNASVAAVRFTPCIIATVAMSAMGGKRTLRPSLSSDSLGGMKIDKHNYEKMRAWLARMAPELFPKSSPETDPILALDRTFATSPANARKGLAMAIGDTIDMTDSWSVERVAAIDHSLRNDGLPTLTDLRRSLSKVIRRVVSQGSIKNEVEYYAVRNAVEQAQDDEGLWKLLADYEGKAES
jgi:hypothetical protein